MSPGEFYERVSNVLLLCNGWSTSGPRSIQHNAKVGGIWDYLHQVGLGLDCQLQSKDDTITLSHRNLCLPAQHPTATKTMGDLFIKLCDRLDLLAIDEGSHFHVQPKRP